jgi:flagellar biosynthetic protein FliR
VNIELASSTLVGFSLALVRTTAWIVICPPFNSPSVPKRVRVALATAIAFAITHTIAPVAPEMQIVPFVMALLTQALGGLALGFTVLVLFSAIQGAGELLDLQIGYSLGAVLDPISGTSAAPISRFHQLMAIILVFAINGHVLVVRGFTRSVEAVPSGMIDLGAFAEQITKVVATYLAASVEIALPVLAGLFLAEVALGLVGKAAPGLNVLVIGFAVKSFVAFGLLGLTLVLLPETAESLITQAVRAAGRAFGG